MRGRRSFLLSAASGALTAPLAVAGAMAVPRVPAPPFAERAGWALREAGLIAGGRPAAELAEDEAYWGEIGCWPPWARASSTCGAIGSRSSGG